MDKYTVTVSYVVETTDSMTAIFALQKSLSTLSETELAKFTPLSVVKEEN
jgi:hypothetical protein